MTWRRTSANARCDKGPRLGKMSFGHALLALKEGHRVSRENRRIASFLHDRESHDDYLKDLLDEAARKAR
jgi:hypothetical protein